MPRQDSLCPSKQRPSFTVSLFPSGTPLRKLGKPHKVGAFLLGLKSMETILPSFISLFPHLFRKFFWGVSSESSTGHSFMGQTELGLVHPVLRSLEPGAEGIQKGKVLLC